MNRQYRCRPYQVTRADNTVSQVESTQTPHPLLMITSAAQLAIRAQILTAARQRFARFDHKDTSIADIARGAGLPLDDVRLHFPDTIAVLLALQRGLDGGARLAARRTQSTLINARKDVRAAHMADTLRQRETQSRLSKS
jgi:AcrR family transcriptional regulator